MANLRWLLAIPIAMAAMVLAMPVQAATIRDGAGMFSPSVVKKLEAELDRIERATQDPSRDRNDRRHPWDSRETPRSRSSGRRSTKWRSNAIRRSATKASTS